MLLTFPEIAGLLALAAALSLYAFGSIAMARKWGWLGFLVPAALVLGANYIGGRFWPAPEMLSKDPRCGTMNTLPAVILTTVIAAVAFLAIGGRLASWRRYAIASAITGLLAALPVLWFSLRWVVEVLGCDTL